MISGDEKTKSRLLSLDNCQKHLMPATLHSEIKATVWNYCSFVNKESKMIISERLVSTSHTYIYNL